jgi:hypothetical protein
LGVGSRLSTIEVAVFATEGCGERQRPDIKRETGGEMKAITIGALLALFYGSAVAEPRYSGPLEFSASDDGRHMTLLKPYGFVDANGLVWEVPKGATVDGASIPRALWPVAGGPFEGKYRNASVLHDWYCDLRTRPWRDVHRMFYEAMRTSGVEESQAKVMYLAVMVGGPRWNAQAIANNRLATGTRAPVSKDAFARMAAKVAQQNLSLSEIDALAESGA